ncbi:MAG: winged helix-turn-helix domain-containing protein [Planctomycetota bacterium]
MTKTNELPKTRIRPATGTEKSNGKPSGQPASPQDTPKAWTFLTNHAHVLIVLYSEPDMVLREVANRVGITERAVQRIVQDLEDEGFIRREKIGRKNHYDVVTGKALRHPVESHRDIGDLIRLITG